MTECLLSMWEALGLIPNKEKRKEKKIIRIANYVLYFLLF